MTRSGQEPVAFVLGCIDSRVPVERVFDQDFDLNKYVESAVEFPRVLVIVAIYTAICGGIYGWVRKERPDLLATAEEPVEPEVEEREPVPVG